MIPLTFIVNPFPEEVFIIYTIIQSFNNNALLVEDDRHEQLIVIGKGIGFNMKKGERIPTGVVEHTYVLQDEGNLDKYSQVMNQVPEHFLSLMHHIMDMVHDHFPRQNLNEKLFINLTDHLFFAVKRQKLNLNLAIGDMADVRFLYPEEFAVGKKIIAYLEEQLRVRLPEVECSFIAIHLYSARHVVALSQIQEHTAIFHEIKQSLSQLTGQHHFEESDLSYIRFMRHLQFLMRRIEQNKLLETTVLPIDYVRINYPFSYRCGTEIIAILNKRFKKTISPAEVVYLSIHVEQLLSANQT